MGSGVLEAAVLDGPRTLRAYAHCAADNPRDLVVLLLNLDNKPLDVGLVANGKTAQAAVRTEWHFTAGAGGLGGTGVRLGGSDVAWVPGQELPPMRGARGAFSLVHLARHSIVFVRLSGSGPMGLC